MTREELIQTPEYWRELYVNECWRLGIKPDKVAFTLVESDKKLLEKACDWLKSYRQETSDGLGYIAGIVNDKTIDDFRKAMED